MQSPAKGAGYLEEATIKFMDSFNALYAELSAEDFEQHKAGLIARLLEAPKNLGERSQLYWGDIADDHLTFNSRQQMAALVEALTKEDMAKFFDRIEAGLDSERLLIYSAGQFPDEPSRGEVLASPTDPV